MPRRRRLLTQTNINNFRKMSGGAQIGFAVFLLVFYAIFTIIFRNLIGYFAANVPFIIFGLVVIYAIPTVMLISGIIKCKAERTYKANLAKSNMDDIDRMSGKEFEDYLGILFHSLEYKATVTKYSGDYGADLILENDTQKIVVQAKCYRNKVPIKAIQEIVSAKNYYSATNAWVVTNSFFTHPAINLARSNNVTLIDRSELAKLICKSGLQSDETLKYQTNTAPETEHPASHTAQEIKAPKSETAASISNTESEPPSGDSCYYHDLQNIKDRIMDYFNEHDVENIYNMALKAKGLPCQNNYDIVSLHYFYIDIIKLLYQLRDYNDEAIDYCLKTCDLNIGIYPKVAKEIEQVYTEALSRKCKILESRKEYTAAIAVCDFAISNGYVDIDRKSFAFRKDRLLKKIDKQLTHTIAHTE